MGVEGGGIEIEVEAHCCSMLNRAVAFNGFSDSTQLTQLVQFVEPGEFTDVQTQVFVEQ